MLAQSTALELSLSSSMPLGMSRSSYTGTAQVLRVIIPHTLLPLARSVMISCPAPVMLRTNASLGDASVAVWPGTDEASSVAEVAVEVQAEGAPAVRKRGSWLQQR